MHRRSRLRSLLAGLLLAGFAAAADQPPVPWVLNPPGWEYVTFGGPGEDGGYNIHPTSDGGYVIAGCTTRPGHGRDMAVYKLRADLSLDPTFGEAGRWVFGGTGDDQAIDAIEVRDAQGRPEGFLLAGYTDKADGDFGGRKHHGKIDIVLARLTPKGALDGSFGERGVGLYGGSGDDEVLVHLHNYSEPGERLLQVRGGFLIAAMSRSRDGDIAGIKIVGEAISRDVMIFKIDPKGDYAADFADRGILRIGTKPPPKAGARDANDFVWSIKPDAGGGFVAAGYHLGAEISVDGVTVHSPGNSSEPKLFPGESASKHQMDGWIFRFDEAGRLRTDWAQRGFVFIGGTRQEKIYDVAVTADGGYLVTGRTASWDLQFSRPPAGVDDFDMALVKFRADGSLDRSFGTDGRWFMGGTESDQGLRVLVSGESIFWLGQSSSTPPELAGKIPPGYFRQIVLVQLSAKGAILQAWNLGREGEEKTTGMALDAKGRVVITGYRDRTAVAEQEDKEGTQRDLFVMRLQPAAVRGR